MDTKEDLQELRKIHRTYAFNLYNSIKKGETYSNVKPTEFFRIMNIDIDNLLSCKKPIGTVSVDDSKITFTARMLSVVFDSEGNPSTGNESKRSDFIAPFLNNLVSNANRQKSLGVKLIRESLVENDFATGNVEFIIVKEFWILIVVEAKKEDWDLGRAQNMLETFVAHSNNVNKGLKKDHIVYGVVSTGDYWEIFSYNGIWDFYGRFHALDVTDTREEIVFDKEKIRKLYEILSYMLENAVQLAMN